MAGWREERPRKLKKVVTGMNPGTIERVIKSHEDRGWVRASEVKKYGNGLGCLMIMENKKKGEIKHASNR